MRGYTLACFVLVLGIQILLTEAQYPPRLNIPGAVLVQPNRSGGPQRPHRPEAPPQLRARKPIPNALPISIPIREDAEEDQRPSILDDEVARLIQSNNRQAAIDDDEPPRPVPFRPERPVPLLRQDLRESPPPRPILRQQEIEEENIPVIRQQLSQPVRQAPPQVVRQHSPPPQPVRQQKARVANPRPVSQQYLDEDDGRRVRNRKPPVQILRKYRTDNEDGSITWGFENEDGTFKEENIGADCIIRGKYGYIDPEGTRREYSYETGMKCDHPEEEYLEELPPQQVLSSRPSSKKQYNVPLRIQN